MWWGQGKNYSHSFSGVKKEKKRSSSPPSHFLCVTQWGQKDNFHARQQARWGLLSELWAHRKSLRITKKPRCRLGWLKGEPAHLCFKPCHNWKCKQVKFKRGRSSGLSSMLLAASKVLQSRAASVFLGCATEKKSPILGHAIKNGLLTVSPIDMVFRERSSWGFPWLWGHSSAFRPKGATVLQWHCSQDGNRKESSSQMTRDRDFSVSNLFLSDFMCFIFPFPFSHFTN